MKKNKRLWEERFFSTNFLHNMLAYKKKCFVPWEDYMVLKEGVRKYADGQMSLAELKGLIDPKGRGNIPKEIDG